VSAAAGGVESKLFIAKHCLRNKNQDARYAIKKLSSDVVSEPERFVQGLIDVAIETRFLGHLSHPNIIRLRAVADCDPCHKDYFIVLDRLYDTLEDRVKKWLSRRNRCTGLAKITDRSGAKASQLYEERIVAAYDLASAIEHLHSAGIVYRDLKPENIGFDIVRTSARSDDIFLIDVSPFVFFLHAQLQRDDVKLFDFGLAKELREKDRSDDSPFYNLTPCTGSLRYMAPEVANEEPYGKGCDVYSFSILLWEMMSLKHPYELYTPKTLREKVYNGSHSRPRIEKSWPSPVKLLLKRGWSQDPSARNTMAQIVSILRKECVRARDGDESGLEHNQRRSTFVFRTKS